MRFDQEQFKTKSIVKEANISWLRMNASVRETIPYKVQSTQLVLQDDFFNFDELTELELSSVFKFIKQPN